MVRPHILENFTMTQLRSARLLLLVTFAFCCAGCGLNAGANQAKQRNDLKQLGLAYHNFHDAKQNGPASWDELIAFDKEAAPAITRVRDAGYTVTWDLKFSQVTGGLSNTVLAKPPGAGPTLMADGSVQ
jgi:hypothetical protein